MEKTIYKYVIKTIGTSMVAMPEGAKILCVQNQFEMVTIWALVDTETGEVAESRKFLSVGTGHHCTEKETKNYIGTVLTMNGNFVSHVFEVT